MFGELVSFLLIVLEFEFEIVGERGIGDRMGWDGLEAWRLPRDEDEIGSKGSLLKQC
jgi:hypothetical protein